MDKLLLEGVELWPFLNFVDHGLLFLVKVFYLNF